MLGRYEFSENNETFRLTAEGERYLLANFTAEITQETRYLDETHILETQFTIQGKRASPNSDDPPITLPPIQVGSDEYPSMSWVMRNWGTSTIIMPGQGIKDDLRVAIQSRSTPTIKTIYRNVGWTKIDGSPCYLHAAGAINAEGNDPAVMVALPPELQLYDLSDFPPAKQALQATMDLLNVGPPEITWPMLAATLSCLYVPVDFAVHVTGKTGTFKSELMSLYLSHYGAGFDARHLPGSWSSTGNALEAQAHAAKNAAFVIDDFVPNGTSWQMKAYQTTADKIIRAQGNQAGRARLNETSTLQRTMYPRGIILSTGEDTPEGHSVRARMLILELSPDDITAQKLTAAQRQRSLYKGTTVAAIQKQIAKPAAVNARAQTIRDASVAIGHSRTPSMIGVLQAVAEQFTQLLLDYKIINGVAKQNKDAQAWNAIAAAGANQVQFLEAADPVEQFLSALRNVFGQKIAHLRKLNGGVPQSPDLLGWSADQNGSALMYRSHGPCIGWIDWESGEVFIDVNAGWQIIKKTAGSEMAMTKQTMTKRLKEAGAITRTDDARQRNTVRITAEDHPRLVIALSLPIALNTKENPQ